MSLKEMDEAIKLGILQGVVDDLRGFAEARPLRLEWRVWRVRVARAAGGGPLPNVATFGR